MDCIPGSHRLGLLSLFGSTVSDENVMLHCPPEKVQSLEVKSGHAVLLHNWLIHRSGVNPSLIPRRAFTMCCMDGRTRSTLTGNHFPLIAGSLPEESEHYFKSILEERTVLQQKAREAEEYAKSLEVDNKALRKMREEAEMYAQSLASEDFTKSLEADNKILRQMRDEAEKYALSLEAERAKFMKSEAERKEREEQKRIAKLEAERIKQAKSRS